MVVTEDEEYKRVNFDKFKTLKAVFQKEGGKSKIQGSESSVAEGRKWRGEKRVGVERKTVYCCQFSLHSRREKKGWGGKEDCLLLSVFSA